MAVELIQIALSVSQKRLRSRKEKKLSFMTNLEGPLFNPFVFGSKSGQCFPV